MRSKSLITAAIGGSLFLSSCGAGGDEVEQTEMTLRIAHVGVAEDNSYESTLRQMNEALVEATEGRISIETYGEGQLGGELEMIEQIGSGNIEGAVLTAGSLSSVAPVVGGMELPYLFKDGEHAQRAVDGAVGDFLTDELAAEGLVPLGFWEMGYKNITNSVRPIQSLDDAAGLQIRVLENPLLVDTYSALGMDPTPLPWGETYTALQQGLVDAYEGPYEPFIDGALYEVQEYASEVQMIYGSLMLILSQEALEGLSEEDQQALLEIGEEYSHVQRETAHRIYTEGREAARENGVEVLEADELDLVSFREAVAHIRDEAAQYSDLVEVVDSVE